MPSTVVRAFNYDPVTHILRVTFVSGMIYDYLDVPEHIYQQMKGASSKGVFLNNDIKGKYEFVKIND